MTVKEVFELRRQGKIEEAYQTILPMYKVHHGKYTTLAMFWCAADMMNLLLTRATDNDSISLASLKEAEKIYLSLQKLHSQIHFQNLHQNHHHPLNLNHLQIHQILHNQKFLLLQQV